MGELKISYCDLFIGLCLAFAIGCGATLFLLAQEWKTCAEDLQKCQVALSRTTCDPSGRIVKLPPPPPPPPCSDYEDSRFTMPWKRERLAEMIDTTCAALRDDPLCQTLYVFPHTCDRAVLLWSALGRAANWTYHPWIQDSPDVTLKRLYKWIQHPGFAKVC